MRKPDSIAWMAACLLAGALTAAALPVQVEEPEFSLTLPDGFAPSTNAAGVYVRYDLGTATPGTWVTIEPAPGGTTNAAVEGDLPRSPAMEFLPPYRDKWRDVGLDIQSYRSATGDVRELVRSFEVPLRPAPVKVTLHSRTMADADMKKTVHAILESLEVRSPDENVGMPGWAKAVLYLVLGAVVVIIALARGIR